MSEAEKEKKICPIMSSTNIPGLNQLSKPYRACTEEKCGIWNARLEQCGFIHLKTTVEIEEKNDRG